MKRIIVTLIVLHASMVLLSQPPDSLKVNQDQIIEEQIFMLVEDHPLFPGGDDARLKYLKNTIQYPQQERDSGIQGLVVVNFIVERDGSITNVKVLKGVSPALDQEAVRVVEAMPAWIPGKQRGKPVRVYINLPIRFTLN